MDEFRKREIEATAIDAWTPAMQAEYLSLLEKFNRSKCGILDFRWPGVASPLYMRCGSSDLRNFVQMFIHREYGFEIPFYPARILDLGAYCGYAAIFLANRFPEAEILCVEPSAANFQILTLNTAAYSRIRRLNVAIWGHSSKLKVADTSGGDWGIRFAESGGGQIPALALPDLLSNVGWKSVDLLKCDIEGAELSVFRESGSAIADMVACCAIEIHEMVAPGITELVRGIFTDRNFAHINSGEFEVFISRDQKEINPPSRVSVLRPAIGLGDICLTNVKNEFWAYSTFDFDSCQLHPANLDQPPAELTRIIRLTGQSNFESEISVDNMLGHGVDFIVRLVDPREDNEVLSARTSLNAGQKKLWTVSFNTRLHGVFKIALQTVMSPNAPTNHQANANWIAPTFH